MVFWVLHSPSPAPDPFALRITAESVSVGVAEETGAGQRDLGPARRPRGLLRETRHINYHMTLLLSGHGLGGARAARTWRYPCTQLLSAKR
jgi:hypothetical protein